MRSGRVLRFSAWRQLENGNPVLQITMGASSQTMNMQRIWGAWPDEEMIPRLGKLCNQMRQLVRDAPSTVKILHLRFLCRNIFGNAFFLLPIKFYTALEGGLHGF